MAIISSEPPTVNPDELSQPITVRKNTRSKPTGSTRKLRNVSRDDEQIDGQFSTDDGRPLIEISSEWHIARDQSIEALASDRSLYNRGGQIVSIVCDGKDKSGVPGRSKMQGSNGSPKIVAVSESNIGCALTRNASFYRWAKDRNGEDGSVPTTPTSQLVKSVATMKNWPGMRILDAIAECPFPRVDGSLVDTEGYDSETRTFFAPSIDFPPVPEHPTHDDAIEAWQRIADIVRDFPFATEDDKVVYLAGLLTIVARPAIDGPVPGIAVSGNKAGTGKGLLIDAMVMPGTGRTCPTSTYPETTEEATKVKVSIAKAAKVAVHFDNLENGGSYGGSTDSALTAIETDDRHLGSNDAPTLKIRTAWFLSGNNISPAKDAHRRWLVCRLETDRENPEDRTDFAEKDFRSAILDRRGEMVRDALTILRAHSIAGRPAPDWPAFGSFEHWDEIVRRAVWYATGRDCRTPQRSTNEHAPERCENLALLEGLSELPDAKVGRRGVTSEKAIKLVDAKPNEYETLRSALVARGRGGKLADSRQLGNCLRSLANSPIGGFKLTRHPLTQRHAIAWIVEKTIEPKCESGESGECHIPLALENFDSIKDAIKYAIEAKTVWTGESKHSPDSPDSHSSTDGVSHPTDDPTDHEIVGRDYDDGYVVESETDECTGGY